MSIKLTYNYIKTRFEQEGYVLLSKEYINAKSKLDYICLKGHTHSITWDHFQSGCRCPSCAGVVKPSIGFIREEFSKVGFTLLSNIYYNSSTKLKYMCDNNHCGSISWDNFKQGKRCRKCFIESNIGEKHPNWKGGVTKTVLPLYDTYASRLEKYHSIYKIEKDDINYLGVECAYCKDIFIPLRPAVSSRLDVIEGRNTGDANFYCSEKCKEYCPIYNRHKYYKGKNPNRNDRPNQSIWADMVKERDKHICQKCGITEEIMYAHHIDPVVNNPIESMDIDNGMTLCKKCHKETHSIDGCTYNDLKC